MFPWGHSQAMMMRKGHRWDLHAAVQLWCLPVHDLMALCLVGADNLAGQSTACKQTAAGRDALTVPHVVAANTWLASSFTSLHLP